MKTFFFSVLLFCFAITTQAQQKAARADYAYLESIAVPNKADIEARFKNFQDSLKIAIEVEYNTKQLEEDMKLMQSNDEAKQNRGYDAQQKMNRINDYYNELIREKGATLSKPIVALRDKMTAVTKEKGFDLCFLYEPSGINDLLYKDIPTRDSINSQIYDCAKERTGKHFDKLKEEAKQFEYNYQEIFQTKTNECKDEFFNPLLQTSVDITELIVQTLNN